jgi:hypothetical protein
MLKACKPSDYWFRDGTGDALIELVNTSLNQNAQLLVNDGVARQAILEITALLVAKKNPTALVLHDRIKQLR